MKVMLTAEMKKVITIAEMPAVNKVIAYMKTEECTAKDYAEMAARVASGCGLVKIIESNAEIACNARVWDAISENTAQYYVWINFTAIIDDGFDGIIMGGAYVSDLWRLANDNVEEIRSQMFIRRFVESK